MLGLFGTLNLGARSLEVQQQGSEVTGQNLANVNNPAYARQRLVTQTSTPMNTPIGQEGTGVQAIAIQQVRDALLDSRIQAEGSVSGSLTAQQSALQNAEAALGEQLDTGATGTSGAGAGSTQNGLAEGLSNLFNGFQSLSTNPSSLSQRQVVIQNAQDLATQFNQVNSQLTDVRDGLNTSIQNDVTAANQDLSDIADLNKQIITAEQAGGTPNDLIDQRQAKIEDLAGKVNITATAQANGGVDINIGGVDMVNGVKSLDSLQAFDNGGGQILVRAQTAGTTLNLTGGSIQGNIDARDGALATLQTNVNMLASQLIIQVNTVYSAGYDLNGNSGQIFFTGNNASTIGVNSALANNPSQFQAAGAPNAPGDNTVALQLAQLADQAQVGLGNQTFSQNFSQTVAGIGSAVSTVNDQIANSDSVSQMLQNQRSSYSGVSLDEEMTNLMQYQKAYQASAELISTINSMLMTVLGMKTA